MTKLTQKIICSIIFTIIILVVGAVTYIFEFTETSIMKSKPLQTLSGFTDPIRNAIGIYGFIGFLCLLMAGVLFSLWLEFKEEKETEEFNKKHSKKR